MNLRVIVPSHDQVRLLLEDMNSRVISCFCILSVTSKYVFIKAVIDYVYRVFTFSYNPFLMYCIINERILYRV